MSLAFCSDSAFNRFRSARALCASPIFFSKAPAQQKKNSEETKFLI
jgi:hypothetical protein